MISSIGVGGRYPARFWDAGVGADRGLAAPAVGRVCEPAVPRLGLVRDGVAVEDNQVELGENVKFFLVYFHGNVDKTVKKS